MNPNRIAQIRVGLDDEHRDHVWSDDVIAELLTEVERLSGAARSAAVLLRGTADRIDSGRPQDVTAIRAAAAALDEIAGPAA